MECLRRGYSYQTISTYNSCLQKFFRIYHKEPKSITKQDVQQYIDQMIKWNKSWSTINVHLSALQFLFSKVLKKKLMVEIPYVKKQKRFPEVLSKEEVSNLIKVIPNHKQQLMIKLLYSAGLRVSELLNLKVKDLEINQGQGWVRQGKGNKDRPFIIAELLKQELHEWIKNNRLENDSILFKGKNKKMHPSSVRLVLKKAAKKTGIKKNIHPHTLRHSFATHLAEEGYAATDIQPLLGHRNVETTLIYTHMAQMKLLNIKSPYDQLEVNE